MLLQELLGVKALKNKTAGQILKQIKAKNGVTMYRGVYGIVLSHPEWDHVLKLFPKDDCYMDFLKFCKTHSSPHLPKVIKGPIELTPFFLDKNEQPVKNLISKYHAVKLEKLAPFPKEQGTEMYNAAFIICTDGNLHAAYRQALKDGNVDAVLKSYTDAYKEHGRVTNLKKYKSFLDMMVKALDSMDKGKCKPDVHIGNLMLRGKTIVIVDPYSAVEKTGMSMMKLISKMDLDALTK